MLSSCGKIGVKKTIIIFSALSAGLMILFHLQRYTFFHNNSYRDYFLVFSGCVFVLIGIFIHKLWHRISEDNDEAFDEEALERTGISKQEYKVLLLMADGLSNVDIGQTLFISESTVKSHVSSILSKLNARRRTQAVRIARDLNIL